MATALLSTIALGPTPLVVSVTSDRETEYEAFFLTNFEPTVRLLRSLGVSQEQAQDATQDAFVKLYTRWSRVRRHESPEAWVRRVAINRSRDLYRSDQRRHHRETKVDDAVESAPAPDDAVAETDAVRRLLLELPKRQRTIAALFYVEDLSIAEIANDLELSAGAVKFHLNRARNRLRSQLDSGR